jgi:hypothetical protein
MVMVAKGNYSESKPPCCYTTAIALNDASTLQETTASREHWCRGPMCMGEELVSSRAKINVLPRLKMVIIRCNIWVRKGA